MSIGWAISATANANKNDEWSIEKTDPLDNIDCAKMVKMGIEKQTNQRAQRIRIYCGLEHPQQQWATHESPFFQRIFTPWAIGGIDVNVTGTASSYGWDSIVWGNGDTLFIAYDTDPSAMCAGGSYGHGSYSTDGGAVFTRLCPNPFATGHGQNYGNPMVVYNAKFAKWYVAFLATGCGGQGIGVWESTDAINWTTGACVHSGTSDDRESMWVDNKSGSPYYGRIYISWNDFSAGQHIYVTHSDDGTTWSPRVQISNTFIRNVQITGSPGNDGTVFIAGMDEGGGGGANRINLVYRSIPPGDATWTNVYTGPPFAPAGSTTCPDNSYFSMIEPIWRHMGWGQIAVGPAGFVHYVYAGAGGEGDNGDIYYIQSPYNGIVWSNPIRLNTDSTTQTQWMPSLVAISSGQILASWYDRRNTTDGLNYERWGRISNDGGASWQNDDVISDVISPQQSGTTCTAGNFDFESANGTTALLTWKDGRVIPQMEIFFDQVELCSSIPTGLNAWPSAINQITVTWDPSPAANCYNVYRSTGACPGGAFTRVSSCQAGTTYVDSSVSGGTTYSYKITSIGTALNCESSFSACASATASCSSAPTGLMVIPNIPNHIRSTWSSVAGANCYNVYKSTGACPGGSFFKVSSCQPGTIYVDYPVSAGVTNSYKITSETIPGMCESSFSACGYATAYGNCLLSPTFDGLASALSAGTTNCQINLAWTAAASNCPLGPNITYHIYKSTDPAFIPTLANRIAQCVTGTTYADINVTFATTYYYIVRAEDSTTAGTGPCNSGNIDTNTVKQNSAPYGLQTILFSDNAGDTGSANMVLGTNWSVATTQNHTPGGSHSYWSGTGVNNACTYLTSPSFSLAGGDYYFLEYWTYYHLETTWDGVILQVSSDGGTAYSKVTPIQGYTGTLGSASTSCIGANQTAYTGNFETWTYANADLAPYAGTAILFRFEYGTDSGLTYDGFWIDDLKSTASETCTTTTASYPGEAKSLMVTKSGTNLILTWSAPGGTCTPTAYGFYRGTLPWTNNNHTMISCAFSGTTPQDAGNYYYLVVPLNSAYEGSYGKSSSGSGRPQGGNPCHPQNLTPCN